MKHKLFKSKYGLLWLVFCVLAVVALQNHRVQVPASLYGVGFLERLDVEGHAIEKHVGKTDQYLRDRLKREDISTASTFNDMAEAESAIRSVLLKRGDLVQAWLDTEKSNKKAFYNRIDKPIGRVLRQTWNVPRSGNQARVVLIRDSDYATGFYILTAYPELK
jgi:hypothetical protein